MVTGMNGNDAVWNKVCAVCKRFSETTYENLTKIIRYADSHSADAARDLDDCFENDVDSWAGGGTCFSMTWFAYREFLKLGLSPKLWMGHKRKEKNIHCALCLPYNGECFLFDPGYLIFELLKIPPVPNLLSSQASRSEAFYPLVPNAVQLIRTNDTLELWTGSLRGGLKLRFEFNVRGVSESEFRKHWSDSFSREMMEYPVLNKLDVQNGIQYYFQKGNLMVRTVDGSTMKRIERKEQESLLCSVFGLSEELVHKALSVLDKKKYI